MKAIYSPLHKAWIVQNPDRLELVLGSGNSKGEAEARAARQLKHAGNR